GAGGSHAPVPARTNGNGSHDAPMLPVQVRKWSAPHGRYSAAGRKIRPPTEFAPEHGCFAGRTQGKLMEICMGMSDVDGWVGTGTGHPHGGTGWSVQSGIRLRGSGRIPGLTAGLRRVAAW